MAVTRHAVRQLRARSRAAAGMPSGAQAGSGTWNRLRPRSRGIRVSIALGPCCAREEAWPWCGAADTGPVSAVWGWGWGRPRPRAKTQWYCKIKCCAEEVVETCRCELLQPSHGFASHALAASKQGVRPGKTLVQHLVVVARPVLPLHLQSDVPQLLHNSLRWHAVLALENFL